MIVLILKELFICLIITIVIEYIPIVIFLKIPKIFFIAVNVLTNVLANVVMMTYDILDAKKYLLINRWQLIIVIELIVCIIEIFLYYAYLDKKNVKIQNINDVSNTTINKVKNFISISDVNKQMFLKVVAITIFANVLSFTIGAELLIAMGR